MGASPSAEENRNTRQKNDIDYLGDRMPFGDAELLQVYRVYQKLQEKFHGDNVNDDGDGNDDQPQATISSFLKDVGVLSAAESRMKKKKKKSPETTTSTTSSETKIEKGEEAAILEERLYLLEAVERKVLPPGFGNTLYRTCFMISQDTSEYDKDDDTRTRKQSMTNSHDDEDEYTRMARMEFFFAGLANGTRRDRKTVTKCLIKCCTQFSVPVDDTDGTNDSAAAINDFAYGSNVISNDNEKKNETYIQPTEFINLGYRLSLAAAFLKEASGENSTVPEGDDDNDDDEQDLGRFLPSEDTESAPGLHALSNSLAALATKRKQRQLRSTVPTDKLVELVDENDVFEWVEQVAPMFGAILPTFLHCIFFPNKPAPPTRSSFDYPRISQKSTVFPSNSSPLLFSFGCMSPALGGEFYRLYTSASDGLSFNRLMNALLGYGGPTLLIIQSGKSIFGAFTASPWKESKDFYGNHDCFLYRLLPETTAVYRPSVGTSRSSNRFMYCNSFARSRGYDQQAHGIGFGGSTTQPRLFLSESFDDCQAGSDDLTFENGPLLAGRGSSSSSSSVADAIFEIDGLEVWGVGGTDMVQEGMQARGRSRDIRQANINKARKVDKAAFLDDLRSGVIENKAFAHRDQVQGRDGTCELLGGE